MDMIHPEERARIERLMAVSILIKATETWHEWRMQQCDSKDLSSEELGIMKALERYKEFGPIESG